MAASDIQEDYGGQSSRIYRGSREGPVRFLLLTVLPAVLIATNLYAHTAFAQAASLASWQVTGFYSAIMLFLFFVVVYPELRHLLRRVELNPGSRTIHLVGFPQSAFLQGSTSTLYLDDLSWLHVSPKGIAAATDSGIVLWCSWKCRHWQDLRRDLREYCDSLPTSPAFTSPLLGLPRKAPLHVER